MNFSRQIKAAVDKEFGCCWNVLVGECFTLNIEYEQLVQVMSGPRWADILGLTLDKCFFKVHNCLEMWICHVQRNEEQLNLVTFRIILTEFFIFWKDTMTIQRVSYCRLVKFFLVKPFIKVWRSSRWWKNPLFFFYLRLPLVSWIRCLWLYIFFNIWYFNLSQTSLQ